MRIKLRLRRRTGAPSGTSPDERVAAAQAEVDLSRQRLHDARENVVKPLNAYAEHNNFANIIAASLAQQRRREAGG